MTEEKKIQKDTKRYEKLMRSFSGAANSLIIYPPGHPIAKKQSADFSRKISDILKQDQSISIHKGEGVFVVNDSNVQVSGKSMEKIVKHFLNFKITDLEITLGLTENELISFLEIFIHSEKNAKVYKSLNEACTKNQIKNIKSLQAAYIRVGKDAKDKLGGKTVGELKISKEEMKRLVSYLKGEIELSYPKELRPYDKFFKNSHLLTNLIDKIVIGSKNLSPEQRKKLVVVFLKRVGNYLSQDSTSSRKQKEAIAVLSSLDKELKFNSQTFTIFGKDKKFKDDINQTVDQIKRLIRNHTVITEYNRHKNKLQKLEKKMQEAAPQILSQGFFQKKQEQELIILLREIRDFFKQISKAKDLSADNLDKIKNFTSRIDTHFKN